MNLNELRTISDDDEINEVKAAEGDVPAADSALPGESGSGMPPDMPPPPPLPGA